MEFEGQLTFLELTTVHYQSDDPYGWLIAYITLIPIIIAIGVSTLVLFKREVRTISVFMGLLFSEFCNVILKKTIKENRPTVWKELRKQSYGMPSSHSQFMFFFAILITLFIASGRVKIKSAFWRVVIPSSLYGLAMVVAYSRVHLFYHTARQVFFGSLTGLCLGSFWFLVIERFLRPYFFPIFINSAIGRYFYLRDSSHIDNLMEFEYNNVMRAEAKYHPKRPPTKSN